MGDLRGLGEGCDEEGCIFDLLHRIYDFLHVKATAVSCKDRLEHCIVRHLFSVVVVVLLRLALLDDFPELVGPLDVVLLKRHIAILAVRWSEAFKDDDNTDAEAGPKLAQDSRDLVLNDDVQVAVTILQTLQRVALSHLTQQQVGVQGNREAIEALQVVDKERVLAPRVLLEILFKLNVHCVV